MANRAVLSALRGDMILRRVNPGNSYLLNKAMLASPMISIAHFGIGLQLNWHTSHPITRRRLPYALMRLSTEDDGNAATGHCVAQSLASVLFLPCR